MSRQARHKKRQRRTDRPAPETGAKTAAKTDRSGLQSEILNLQRSAGNKVVTQLLQEGAGDQQHHTNVDSPQVDSVLGQSGQPLDPVSRDRMEGLFNEDFGGVRVHTGADAAESARAVNAAAYTAGEDVVFGANQYDPNTSKGNELLAHELAHTIQQRDAGVSSSPGAATTISRQPLPGTKEREPISLFSAKIPAPVVTRIGSVIVATVYFGQNHFLMDSRNLTAVDKLREELRYMMDPSVAVDGYASTEGKEEQNLRLSENRRRTVLALLGSTGTAGGKAHGSADLAVEETGKKGEELDSQKALNRRVTIVIMPKTTPAPAEEEKKTPIKLYPDIKVKPETDEEAAERRVRESLKWGEIKKPEEKTLKDYIQQGIDKVADDIARSAPEKLRPYVKKAVRMAADKGVKAVFDKAMDELPMDEDTRDQLKQEFEKYWERKPGK